MLGWIYGGLFIFQMFWLMWTCRKHKRIGLVLVANLLSAGLALFLLWYFDTLPGHGPMPGFAYFPEVFYSLCAAAAFAVLALITILCWLYHRKQ